MHGCLMDGLCFCIHLDTHGYILQINNWIGKTWKKYGWIYTCRHIVVSCFLQFLVLTVTGAPWASPAARTYGAPSAPAARSVRLDHAYSRAALTATLRTTARRPAVNDDSHGRCFYASPTRWNEEIFCSQNRGETWVISRLVFFFFLNENIKQIYRLLPM